MTASHTPEHAPPGHRSPLAVAILALLAALVLFCAAFVFRQQDDRGGRALATTTVATTTGPGGAEAGAADRATRSVQPAAGAVGHVPAVHEVRAIQEQLTRLQFLEQEVTGEWDETTIRALMSFQRWAGLKADGLWSPRTEAAVQAALDNGDLRIQAQGPEAR